MKYSLKTGQVLQTESHTQLRAFGMYFTKQVASNNNPAIFNPYYARAIRCYERAYAITEYPVYQAAIEESYLAWANNLVRAKQCRAAKEKLQKVLSADKQAEVQYVQDAIAACLEEQRE